MTHVRRLRVWLSLLALALLVSSLQAADLSFLGRGERVADGVWLYRLQDPKLVEPPLPTAAFVLRLDPRRVDLRSVLAADEVLGTETVLDMARRRKAIAAINAGFFAPNGDPAGLLKVGGELVSEMLRPRGAIAISDPGARVLQLLFGRVTAQMSVMFDTPDGQQATISASINGVRRRDELTVYTPRFHEDTATATPGVEWVLRGRPLTVIERRDGVAAATIPPDGIVLSFGGPTPPPALNTLRAGTAVRISARYRAEAGADSRRWESAYDIVGGAGLLVRDGKPIEDWTVEDLRQGFDTERHPRTMIGVDGRGDVWLVAVDGRQLNHSIGMTFGDLQRLAARLGLRDALNLDGGGSTTLVVRDAIANQPSDPQGPRKVSDALIVTARRRGR
jgi:hypothetical protein